MKRSFSVFMVFLLLFVMIPVAFANPEVGAGPDGVDPRVPNGAGPGNPNGGDASEPSGVDPGNPSGADPSEPGGVDSSDSSGAGPSDPGGAGPSDSEDIDPGNSSGVDPNGSNGGDASEPSSVEPGDPSVANPSDPKGDQGDGKDVTPPSPQLNVWHFIIAGTRDVTIAAELPHSLDAKGKWTFTMDGKTMKKNVTGPYAETVFNHVPPGTHRVKVTFNGKVDGQDTVLTKDYPFTMPKNSPNVGLKITYDGKKTVGGRLTNARQAKGEWFIYLGDIHDEKDYLMEVSEMVDGLKYAHTFEELKPGEYYVFVMFMGEIDGVSLAVMNEGMLKMKADGTGSFKPGQGVDQPSVIAHPHTGKKIVEDMKKGGKLPQTATRHSAFALWGAVMLLAGLALLKFRTVRG